MLTPIVLAISQLSDPAFRGVFLRSVVWSIGCFAALHIGAVWVVHRVLELHGWLAWGADILGSVGASLLALWLFLPVAAAIGTMYIERIARAVEHRYYPALPAPDGASVFEQARDGVAVALKVLILNISALFLAFLLPGIGLVLGWAIAAYAIGRGLFVMVAMRRMPRQSAALLYRRTRGPVLAHGAILALAAYVPILNLLIPVVGAAAMVHILGTRLTVTEICRS